MFEKELAKSRMKALTAEDITKVSGGAKDGPSVSLFTTSGHEIGDYELQLVDDS